MRMYIGKYLQEKLLMYKELDMVDIVLLEYLDDFKASGYMNEYIKDGKAWNWISWSKISKDMPILGISNDSIKNRCLFRLGTKPDDFEERYKKASESYKKKMKNYKYFGFLEFETVKVDNIERTIFRFTEEYYNIRVPFRTNENKKDLPVAADKPNDNVNTNTDNDKIISLNNKKMQILLASGFTKKDILEMSESQIDIAVYKLSNL